MSTLFLKSFFLVEKNFLRSRKAGEKERKK